MGTMASFFLICFSIVLMAIFACQYYYWFAHKEAMKTLQEARELIESAKLKLEILEHPGIKQRIDPSMLGQFGGREFFLEHFKTCIRHCEVDFDAIADTLHTKYGRIILEFRMEKLNAKCYQMSSLIASIH